MAELTVLFTNSNSTSYGSVQVGDIGDGAGDGCAGWMKRLGWVPSTAYPQIPACCELNHLPALLSSSSECNDRFSGKSVRTRLLSVQAARCHRSHATHHDARLALACSRLPLNNASGCRSMENCGSDSLRYPPPATHVGRLVIVFPTVTLLAQNTTTTSARVGKLVQTSECKCTLPH